jgi:tyrosyl-tRNA synthetase
MEIVERFHGKDAAQAAKAQFDNLFGVGNRAIIPEDAPTFKFLAQNPNGYPLLNALVEAELVASNGEGKRLVRQGGVSVDGARIDDIQHCLIAGEHMVRAGKKRWASIIIA